MTNQSGTYCRLRGLRGPGPTIPGNFAATDSCLETDRIAGFSVSDELKHTNYCIKIIYVAENL